MYTILGVDPGSATTGYGIIKEEEDNIEYIASGVIAMGRNICRYERIKVIFLDLSRIVESFSPTHFAIEDVFYSKNPKSALVLGEARGAAILAASIANVPIHEYSPREVKQAVTGSGAAHKSQVSFMLKKLLGLSEPPANTDESDALAVAICHAFRRREWEGK
ncbi:MAG: crossover junction endodeoxyribonuclease RuvC [Candidatus Latescibacteria bacterium]|nr:crossover junction endodeoxyribonuclease RuvC [Candidatus Latescibacterota bacterium]NIM66510.1 crossover junction endodeoxyribonuclease RuvC [Candidatus Latescibacterota bacterium]NIO02990.1 crossover junction endodeoxyribonuclease RuvC [Candidatus Latescibacterota bacterium]NIO30125.1 crossover junction endodeoxyribonuclease RuvC [Candidatus Latescibacterota bacterium]NIO57744.1 crossover junction endodeoxyribonuclease RuvC [Candidatus Latescibacterota bacterium]